MKTLFILRHAKSSWSEPELSDFDRPLNERGLKAAPIMGELMKENAFQPSIVLSSPAARAKATAELVKEAGSLEAEIRYDEGIYGASPSRLVETVSGLDDDHSSTMLVGHNPGIEGFIRYLTGQIEPMPTAALAVIELRIDKWRDLNAGSGDLRSIFRPKELAAGK